MIKTVVVPLDGSASAEEALRPACALARASGATVRLVAAPLSSEPERRREAAERLERQAGRLGVASVECVVAADASAADAILDELREPGSLACMATHGRSGLGYVALGSVAEAVVRSAPGPVLLVGPHVDAATSDPCRGELLVTINGSSTSETVVPSAAAWAEEFGMTTSVLEVLPGAVGILAEPPEPAAERERVHHVAERLRAAGSAPRWNVLHGANVPETITEHAEQLPASLIVMATHGRTGVTRFALGSVAMHVVHGSHCPVLVVRPSGHDLEVPAGRGP